MLVGSHAFPFCIFMPSSAGWSSCSSSWGMSNGVRSPTSCELSSCFTESIFLGVSFFVSFTQNHTVVFWVAHTLSHFSNTLPPSVLFYRVEQLESLISSLMSSVLPTSSNGAKGASNLCKRSFFCILEMSKRRMKVEMFSQTVRSPLFCNFTVYHHTQFLSKIFFMFLTTFELSINFVTPGSVWSIFRKLYKKKKPLDKPKNAQLQRGQFVDLFFPSFYIHYRWVIKVPKRRVEVEKKSKESRAKVNWSMGKNCSTSILLHHFVVELSRAHIETIN